jgi:hypothetical protein
VYQGQDNWCKSKMATKQNKYLNDHVFLPLSYIIHYCKSRWQPSKINISMFISHTLNIIVFLPCLGHNYVSVPSLIIKTSFHMPFPWHTRHARVMSLASTLYYWEKISNIYRNVYEISN